LIDGVLKDGGDVSEILSAIVERDARLEDCGNGAYEFWGAKGNHVDYQWIDYAPEYLIIDIQSVDMIPVKESCTVTVGKCECDCPGYCRCREAEFSYQIMLDHIIEGKYAHYKVIRNE
jgi:hypothetical protein